MSKQPPEPTVFCHYLKETKPALSRPPMPGDLGIKIQKEISRDAWQKWLIEQTKILNEYRLDPTDESTIKKLEQACRDFLFN